MQLPEVCAPSKKGKLRFPSLDEHANSFGARFVQGKDGATKRRSIDQLVHRGVWVLSLFSAYVLTVTLVSPSPLTILFVLQVPLVSLSSCDFWPDLGSIDGTTQDHEQPSLPNPPQSSTANHRFRQVCSSLPRDIVILMRSLDSNPEPLPRRPSNASTEEWSADGMIPAAVSLSGSPTHLNRENFEWV